jgi:hypothetical protein
VRVFSPSLIPPDIRHNDGVVLIGFADRGATAKA